MDSTKRRAAKTRAVTLIGAASGGIGGGVAGGVGAALGLQPLGYVALAALTTVLAAIVLSWILGRR